MTKRELKENKKNGINQWLARIKKETPGLCYRLDKIDTVKALDTMTLEQLQFCLSLTAAASGNASESTRKYWSPKYHAMRQALERKTGDANISFGCLKLVRSE